MRKFLIYLLGFFVLAQTSVIACNFKISNFGDPKENVKIEPIAPDSDIPIVNNFTIIKGIWINTKKVRSLVIGL